MALTEREQQVLEELEEDIRITDESLHARLSQLDPGHGHRSAGRFSVMRILAGIATIGAGAAVIALATCLWYSVGALIMGVAGAAIIAAGILCAVSTNRPGKNPFSGDRQYHRVRYQQFMADQERRWDENRY